MEFAIGFLGALASLLIFAAGAFCGWQARKNTTAVTAERLTEQQRQQQREEQEAWRALHNYGVDDAYDLHHVDDLVRGG